MFKCCHNDWQHTAGMKGGCWPEQASILLCCSARVLSALSLAAWVELGNTGPDLEAGADYEELTLQESSQSKSQAQVTSREQMGNCFQVRLAPTPAALHCFVNSPVERLLSPRSNFTSQDLAEPFWELCSAPPETQESPSYTQADQLWVGVRSCLGPSSRAEKLSDILINHMTLCSFLLLHSTPTLQTRCCRTACRIFLAGMQHVLSRMLLSTGGPSDPILLRYFPVIVSDCQEQKERKERKKAQKIIEFGFRDTEKRGNGLIILAMLIISFFVL